jgi:hypothetical protein
MKELIWTGKSVSHRSTRLVWFEINQGHHVLYLTISFNFNLIIRNQLRHEILQR